MRKSVFLSLLVMIALAVPFAVPATAQEGDFTCPNQGGTMVVTYGTDPRTLSGLYANDGMRRWLGNEEVDSWAPTLSTWTNALVKKWLGSWLMLSSDGGATWGRPVRAPVSTPHGPIVLLDENLLYFGKDSREMSEGKILAAWSSDSGEADSEGSRPARRGMSKSCCPSFRPIQTSVETCLSTARAVSRPSTDRNPS